MNRGWKRRCSRGAGSASPCAGWSSPCGDKPAPLLSCHSSCKNTELRAALASWASALWEILLHLTGGSEGEWLQVFPKWSSHLDSARVIPAPDGSWWSSFQEDLLHDPARLRGDTGWPLPGSPIVKKGVVVLLLQSVGISPGCHNSSNIVDLMTCRYTSSLPMDLCTFRFLR